MLNILIVSDKSGFSTSLLDMVDTNPKVDWDACSFYSYLHRPDSHLNNYDLVLFSFKRIQKTTLKLLCERVTRMKEKPRAPWVLAIMSDSQLDKGVKLFKSGIDGIFFDVPQPSELEFYFSFKKSYQRNLFLERKDTVKRSVYSTSGDSPTKAK